jgi:branched-chain amino acid transport system permease protein
MSLSFIWGYAGISSFGQNAFFGVGAYSYGVIALNTIGPFGQTHLAVLGGIVSSTGLALLVGYFLFYGRLSDVYGAIVTLVLSLVLYAFAVSTAGDEWVIGVARLGGFNGLFGQGTNSGNIGNFQIPHITVRLPGMSEPMAFRIDRNTTSGYFLVLGTCIAVYATAKSLLRTRLGRVAVAIRENEGRAATFGYDVRFYKLIMFTLSGAIAGIAGVLFVAWGNFVNPDVFGLSFASSVVVNVLLGGRITLIGGFFGAVALNYLAIFLGGFASNLDQGAFSSASEDPSVAAELVTEVLKRVTVQAPLIIQGAVLVITILLVKKGMVPMLSHFLQQWQRFGWILLWPAVAAFFLHQVACRQASLCLNG